MSVSTDCLQTFMLLFCKITNSNFDNMYIDILGKNNEKKKKKKGNCLISHVRN